MRRTVALAALGALLGCEGLTPVVVRVWPVPEAATTLEVSVKLHGVAAEDMEPFALTPGRREQTFGLRLPPSRRGRLLVGAGALDEAAGLLGVGFAENEFRGAPDELVLPLEPVPGGRSICGEAPVLLSVTPRLVPSVGQVQVTLRGWGFRSNATVTIAGIPAASQWRSRSEIVAQVPPYPRALDRVPQPVQVAVTNRDEQGDAQDGILGYFATNLEFDASEAYAVCSGPRAIAIGDTDRDGDNDLTAACRDDGIVRLLRNTGQQMAGKTVLLPDEALPAGQRPSALLLSPLEAGDQPALIVASAGDNVVTVREGMRPFGKKADYVVNLGPAALALADLDGDGRRDLAVTHEVSRDVAILFGQGEGRLAGQGRSIGVGRGPLTVAAADLDGDGRADLAVGNLADSSLTLLRRLTAGAAEREDLPLGTSPVAIAAGDLDGDGRPDLAVLGPGALQVLRNRGLGGFHPDEADIYPTDRRQPATLALADLNGDGLLDVAAALAEEHEVQLWLSQGQGALRASRPVGLLKRPLAMAVGDLDQDGRPEIVVGQEPDGVVVLWNRSR